MFYKMARHRQPIHRSDSSSPGSRSWRDIRQAVNPRAMSRAGRRRRRAAAVRAGAAAAALLAAGVGGFVVHRTWKENPARIRGPVPAVPLRRVVFGTNGVLGATWVARTLALPQHPKLMTLNLVGLEHRLLASGQVQSATLRRRFRDDALVVTLRERIPVARVMAQAGDGTPHQLLVAGDGVVYDGVGYGRPELDGLPWLDGFVLRRSPQHGFVPIAGMDRVADLLSAARALVPRLYAGWRVVSLARLTSDREILVRSRDIPEIIFDAGAGFPRQLEKLDYVVDALHSHGNPAIARVNFTVGSQVPVELQDSSTLPLPRSLLFSPRAQPRSRRDF